MSPAPARAWAALADAAAGARRHILIGSLAVGLALAPTSPGAALLVAAGVLAALAALRAPGLALAAAALLLAGAWAGDARLAKIDSGRERVRPGQGVAAAAHLLERPRPAPFGISFTARLTTGPARGARVLVRVPRHDARTTGALLARVAPGQEVRLAGVLRRPPPGTGYAGYLRRRGLAGELTAAHVRATGRRRGGAAGVLDTLRRRAEHGVGAGLSAAEADLARGMVLGQDEGIEPAVLADFRAAGLGHLLAVSGQNVMLLAALALPLLAVAGLAPSARFAVTIALIALYVPVAGAGPSLQRAAVMGAASLAALALARRSSRAYALLVAAAVTLGADPRASADPGWQLSFVAVVGILVLAPALRAALAFLPRAVAEGVAITLAATLATAPLVAHHFDSVPIAGLPANVAALPLVAPIMWLGMLRAAAGQLAGAGGLPARAGELASAPIGWALEPPLGALSAIARAFADMRGGSLALPVGSRAGLAMAYLLLAAAAVVALRLTPRLQAPTARLTARWRRLPRARRAAAAGLLAVLVTVAMGVALRTPGAPSRVTVSFLDVGQGDATLIQHPDGTAVLFDGGPPEASVARALRRAGVRRLSALVLTHASRDHHGGLAEVVRRIPVDLVLDGGDGARDPSFRRVVEDSVRRGARRVRAQAPLDLRAGGVSVRIISPPPRPPGPPPEDPNPRAVTALVRAGGLDLLLSADAESPTLDGLDLPPVDAIKVPHHGSSDPGLPGVLARVRPRVAAISVGPNTYGHPAPATLAALRAVGARVVRTDRNGTVRLVVEDGAARVDPERPG